MSTLVSIVAASLISFGTYTASAQKIEGFFEEFRRFVAERRLLAECTPMGLLVKIQDKEPDDLGLTKEAVVQMAESRLRAARLFTKTPFNEESYQELVVIVTGVRIAFNVRLYLTRDIDDTGFGSRGTVSIWELSSSGVHGGNGRFVFMAVSELVDEFVASYLRANEKWCADNK